MKPSVAYVVVQLKMGEWSGLTVNVLCVYVFCLLTDSL